MTWPCSDRCTVRHTTKRYDRNKRKKKDLKMQQFVSKDSKLPKDKQLKTWKDPEQKRHNGNQEIQTN